MWISKFRSMWVYGGAKIESIGNEYAVVPILFDFIKNIHIFLFSITISS